MTLKPRRGLASSAFPGARLDNTGKLGRPGVTWIILRPRSAIANRWESCRIIAVLVLLGDLDRSGSAAIVPA